MRYARFETGEAIDATRMGRSQSDAYVLYDLSPPEEEQLGVIIRALRLYSERNVHYNDNWKRMGWRGMLIRVRERSDRLWDSLWDFEAMSPNRIELIDDALDMINFACFLVRAVHEGNRDGSWW